MATAGATPRPLVDEAEVDAEKVFSPSFESRGTAVFFHAETAAGSALKRAERGENGVLHVATIADDKAKNYHVRLSPDGRAIAFDSDRDGVRGIYVARADGTDVRRVTGDGFAAVPSWSPDGGRLAFLRDEPGRPDVWNLWTQDLASGATVRHTNYRYGQVWGGAWFPDGRRLAYSHEDPSADPRSRVGADDELRFAAKGTTRPYSGGVAGWPLGHLPGPPRRRLAARGREWRDAARPRRRVGRGVRVVARRPSGRVPQPPQRPVEPVADVVALTRAPSGAGVRGSGFEVPDDLGRAASIAMLSEL